MQPMRANESGGFTDPSEEPTVRVPRPRPVSGPVKHTAYGSRRSLRDAVLLLTQKLEARGIDCTDITEMLGASDR